MRLTQLALELSAAVLLGMWVWSFFLRRRCTGPYTLLAASTGQKWQWSIGLSLLRTLVIPLFGLLQPVINPAPEQWSFFLVTAGVVWLMLFFLLTRITYRSFERRLRNYHKINQQIRLGNPPHTHALQRWWMGKEAQRFYHEGYPPVFHPHVNWPDEPLSD